MDKRMLIKRILILLLITLISIGIYLIIINFQNSTKQTQNAKVPTIAPSSSLKDPQLSPIPPMPNEIQLPLAQISQPKKSSTTIAGREIVIPPPIPPFQPISALILTPVPLKSKDDVIDVGYTSYLSGFANGLYDVSGSGIPDIYCRAVGDLANNFIACGPKDDPYKYSSQNLDQGYPGTRVMMKISNNNNALFCRSVGDDHLMACVNSDGKKWQNTDQFHLKGEIGSENKFGLNTYAGPAIVLKPEPSSNMVIPEDVGYPSSVSKFANGFYDVAGTGQANVYCRAVGDLEKNFIACGSKDNPYQYSSQNLDQGYSGTRVMMKIPFNRNALFCRSAGDDHQMACVNSDGKKWDPNDQYYRLGDIGHERTFSLP